MTEALHLPAPSPDLVLAVDQRGEIRCLRCSPQVAPHVRDASGFSGTRLERFLAATTPPLAELVIEVVREQKPLTGILLRLPETADSPTLNVDLTPGGLTNDFRAQQVLLTFSRPTSSTPPPEHYGLVGESPALRELLRKIELYGPTDAALIVTGETGTGKELVAKALHDASHRDNAPFVAVNCSAISEELLESELFGHEKGAFTGAVRSHRGRFERADGGTLFLDEIGDMPLHTQTRLLRILETGEVERVGGEQVKKVDVRVVAATNVPLEQAVGEGKFRADLYHRLSVLRLHLAPLRQRSDDIPLLVAHFLKELSTKYGRTIQRLTQEAMELLQSYLWPGNIRELRNIIERVFIETQNEVIGVRAFSEWVQERRAFSAGIALPKPEKIAPPYPLLTELEERHPNQLLDLDAETIRVAWQASHGNLSATARHLGIHRATLYRHLDRLGLDREALSTPSEAGAPP
ncbi:MAG: sigma-54-dependent Fis family transcriptional regulator [Desulfuromonas sp.]|nr:MAG: sigma-54-dependent Fis family transcriptional regulator [Desulfuromonas sp.]